MTIESTEGGTTDPLPGTYSYPLNTDVQVTAIPNQNTSFTGWTGDASGTANPISVTMGRDKTIKANFRVYRKLTIQPSAWGTTTPAAGVHFYPLNIDVQVTAIPAQYATFVNWTGDASGTDNPVTVKMTRDKTIKADIRYIFPPTNLTGSKDLNRSFSQAEYIDTLSWQANSNNAALTIAKYKIYTVSGSTYTLLTEVNADQSQYSRRNAGSGANQYAITAVTSGGREGAPALVTVQ
ncbi:MAG: hypothetical protein NTW38_06885 [Candidatus Aminicenantes bacterium]|nr:hypothetical protein [Candidatus Aminicenantes bacterium]